MQKYAGRPKYQVHTSLDSFFKWTKISSLKIDLFGIKSGLDFLILKFTDSLGKFLNYILEEHFLKFIRWKCWKESILKKENNKIEWQEIDNMNY